MKKVNFTITNGPSREELFDSLRLGHEGKKLQITIQRQNGGTEEIQVILNSVAAEDGSGQSWIIGFVTQTAVLLFPKVARLNPDPSKKIQITAWYSTKTRKGSFGIVVDTN